MKNKTRNILLAIVLIFFIYFEIHSCSENTVTAPEDIQTTIESVLSHANNVFFVDRDTGWLVGQEGTVARTTDGGKNWKGSKVDNVNFLGVYFMNSSCGWIVGEKGKIYRTENGGMNWNLVVFNGYPGDNLHGVKFMNKSLGFVLGDHGVYRTDDGGVNWQNNWIPVVQDRNAWGMSVIDSSRAFLLGSRFNEADPEIMYKTEDSGKSWATVEGTNFSILRGVFTIYFVNADTGWGGGSVLLKTEDGGKTWVSQQDGPAEIRDFFFKGKMMGFAVGNDKIIRTVDGGDNWSEIMPGDERIVDMRDICFVDDDYGWIVGRGREEVIDDVLYSYSVVLNTTDGGESWTVKELPWKIQTSIYVDE
ncbi:hypothetical protein J7M07_07575 [bacterium]|nr:hypothetical protein [bacterium]